MRLSFQTILLHSLAASCLALAACGADPRDKLLGNWKVHPQNSEGAGARDVNQLNMKVTIKDDGTFKLTGGPVFEGMAGVKEVTGTYDFVDDHTIHVEMKTRAFDYEPTEYAINEISRSELLLNAENHTVSLLRDD